MYEQALALAQEDSFLHLNFVALLEKVGSPTKAAVEAKRCCELIPQKPELYFHTATLLVRAGQMNEAIDYFSRSLAHPRGLYGSTKRDGRDCWRTNKSQPRPLSGSSAHPVQPGLRGSLHQSGISPAKPGKKRTRPWPVISRRRIWSPKARRIISTGPIWPLPGINGMKRLRACAPSSRPGRIFGRRATSSGCNWRPKARWMMQNNNFPKSSVIGRIICRPIWIWEPPWPPRASGTGHWPSFKPFYNWTRQMFQPGNKSTPARLRCPMVVEI